METTPYTPGKHKPLKTITESPSAKMTRSALEEDRRQDQFSNSSVQQPPSSANKIKDGNARTEPSPISIRGGAIGRSMPATPSEANRLDLGSGFGRITHTANQYSNGIMAKATTASQQHDPFISEHSTIHKRLSDGSLLYANKTGPTRTSPQQMSTTGNASFESSPRRSAHDAPTGDHSSPHSSARHDASRRPDENKVSLMTQDDPFITKATPDQIEPVTTLTSPIHPLKAGLTPTNDTAQAIYPPQACVFIANLTQAESDESLEGAVKTAFEQFGNVYIKIRRDARQMPFAFAQYTNIEDAKRAIALGRGLSINGRPCRTEVARVNRSLYLSKITGGPISEDEARHVLAPVGPIEALWHPSQTESEIFHLCEGIFVRFAFFDDCRDAQAKIRTSDMYRLEQIKGIEDGRPSSGNHQPSVYVPKSALRRENLHTTSPSFFMQRTVDARSIFISNIPGSMTEQQLSAYFKVHGRVVNCEIVRRPSQLQSSGSTGYAFIEFETQQAAVLAVHTGHRHPPHLRVEYKEPSTRSHMADFHNGSPRRLESVNSEELLAAFQRGVSLGVQQAAQVQAHTQLMSPTSIFGAYPFASPFETALHAPPCIDSQNDTNMASKSLTPNHIPSTAYGLANPPHTSAQTAPLAFEHHGHLQNMMTPPGSAGHGADIRAGPGPMLPGSAYNGPLTPLTPLTSQFGNFPQSQQPYLIYPLPSSDKTRWSPGGRDDTFMKDDSPRGACQHEKSVDGTKDAVAGAA